MDASEHARTEEAMARVPWPASAEVVARGPQAACPLRSFLVDSFFEFVFHRNHFLSIVVEVDIESIFFVDCC